MGGIVTIKAVHACDCSTAIVRRHSPTAAMNSSSTASQPAQTGKALRRFASLSPAFKVQFRLPGEATPHRNQRYYSPGYFALLLPVP